MKRWINSMNKTGKKIIYIINSLHPGGAEMGLNMLIDYGLFNNTQLHIVCLGRSNSDLEKRIEKAVDGRVLYLSDSEVSNKNIPLYVTKFIKHARNLKPEIVISSLSQSVLVARIAKIFCSYKLITFEHNTEFQNRMAWRLMKLTDFITDKFWCDSGSTEKALLARSHVKNKVLPLFFMAEKKFTKKEYAIGKRVKLMAVGRLAHQKKYTEAIDAIHHIRAEGIDVQLSIYGEGELRGVLSEKIKALNLTDAIHMKGFVDNWVQEAASYDAYLLMSDFEGLSIATLEAMSVGLPCIVKPVGELQNYIINNKTGLVVKTPKQVLEVIKRLINEPDLAEHIGHLAMEYVAENHSEQVFNQQLLEARKDLEIINV